MTLKIVMNFVLVVILLGCKPSLSDDQRLLKKPLADITHILNEPIIASSLRGAKLNWAGNNEYSWSIFKLTATTSDVNIPATECDIRLFKSGAYDFLLFAADDASEYTIEPEWGKMEPIWDKFVEKFWPGAKRRYSWQNRIAMYSPSQGTFPMEYSVYQHELPVENITLAIRLADGKIGGIRTSDEKAILNRENVPPALLPITITSSVKSAMLSSPTCSQLTNVSFDPPERYVDGVEGEAAIADKVEVHAIVTDANRIRFEAIYNEDNGKVIIDEHMYADPLPTNATPEITHPRIIADDKNPCWSDEGHLFFLTSRPTTKRPWWRGFSENLSPVVMSVYKQKTSAETIRPIKQSNGDQVGYSFAYPSPDAHLLAVGQQDTMLIVDLIHGVSFIPKHDARWINNFKRMTLDSVDVNDSITWRVHGLAWLPSDDGFLVSRDQDRYAAIFLASWKNNPTPQFVTIRSLVELQGDVILPVLDHLGQKLAYAHNVGNGTRWQVEVADYNSKLEKVANIKQVGISGAPTSLAWDAAKRIWVVIADGKIYSIVEAGGKLLVQLTCTPKTVPIAK